MLETREEKQIRKLIEKSLKGNRESQKKLYKQFYGYGMTVCISYAKSKEEAQEVLNDGFVKVFKNLHKFDFKKPFKYWFRRILINTAIDQLRSNNKYHKTTDIEEAYDVSVEADGLNNLSAQEILVLVQRLAPSYRAVFNLFVVEEFSHKEIAEKLNIGIGTSKSNLAIARQKLKKMLLEMNKNVVYGK